MLMDNFEKYIYIYIYIYMDLCLALSSMMSMLSKYVRQVAYRACALRCSVSEARDCIQRSLALPR